MSRAFDMDPLEVYLDTGFGNELLTPETRDRWWSETDGDNLIFDLTLTSEREPADWRAKLTGQMRNGSEVRAQLLPFADVLPEGVPDEDDYDTLVDLWVTEVKYVRVPPEHRGRQHAVTLLRTVREDFVTGRPRYVVADLYSQRVLRAFEHVFGLPYAAHDVRTGLSLFQPSKGWLAERLDLNPMEGHWTLHSYGYKLQNSRHLWVVWKF